MSKNKEVFTINTGKKIPYGMSNFADIRLQNYIYIDKTKYIEILESYGEKYIFFLRPRRFGKSLFLSTLEHYYDIMTKNVVGDECVERCLV